MSVCCVLSFDACLINLPLQMAIMPPVSVHEVDVSFHHGPWYHRIASHKWQIKIFSASSRHASFDHTPTSKYELRLERQIYASTCDTNFMTPTSQ